MLQFMTRLGRAAIVLAITGSTVACATVTRGTKESWTVRTEPPGAAVKTSTGMSCEATPCTIDKLKRNVDFDVALTKAGYKTVQTRVTHAVAGAGATAFVGNVLIGGVIGAGHRVRDPSLDGLVAGLGEGHVEVHIALELVEGARRRLTAHAGAGLDRRAGRLGSHRPGFLGSPRHGGAGDR